MNIELSRASVEQLPEIARVFRRSREVLLTFLPQLHSLEEDIQFFENKVWNDCEIFIASSNDQIVGFVAFQNSQIDHLYLLPEYVGLGIGRSLLDKAKQGATRLDLWVFQDNQKAIEFYLSNGFKVVKRTNGHACEEKLPDCLMRWTVAPNIVS